jgi:hypothetical protein
MRRALLLNTFRNSLRTALANIFTNTSLFDILSRLGRLEPPVSEEQARDEVRDLLEQLKIHPATCCSDNPLVMDIRIARGTI